MIPRFCLFVFCSFQLLTPPTFADDVAGCGGFVDFKGDVGSSPIKVKLFTSKGSLKYSSDIAPNNGYYFVPLYDHGEYVLKVSSPKGLAFDPEEVKINFDGENDLCSKQLDINFAFKGFGIFGKISSPNSEFGPAEVKVNLLSETKLIQSTISGENGAFSFSKVLPGKYSIEASHEKFMFNRKSISVVVSDSNLNIDSTASIQISGYPIQGRVVNEGNSVSNVNLVLFSASNQDVHCDSSAIPKFVSHLEVSTDLKYLCSALTDQNGVFKFASLPNGKYTLFPYYESQQTRFEVLPKQFEFTVSNEEFIIENAFEIGGFTISGLVSNHLNANDEITPESVVFVKESDGSVISGKILKNGKYSVDGVRNGAYIVKVSASNYFFEDAKVVVSHEKLTVPDIHPAKFQICGTVALKGGSQISQLKLGVMEFIDKRTSLEYFTFKPNKFCAMVGSAKYSIFIESPLKGPQFIPKTIEVTLDKPMLDLKFEQFSAKVSGRVVFKDTFNQDVTLSLTQGNKLLVTKSFKSNKKIIDFEFEDIASGEYSIAMDQDLQRKFCWKKDALSFTVSDTNVENILFEQEGFLCRLSLSHASDIVIKSPSGKILNLKKDSFGAEQYEKQCLDEVGEYEVKTVGCHLFAEDSNVFKFDTRSMLGQVLTLQAVKHRVSGIIRSTANLTDLKLKIISDQQVILLDEFDKSTENGQNVYLFSFYEKPNTKLRLEPMSGDLLFRPSNQEVTVEGDCLSLSTSFIGRLGVKIDGKVEHNIDAVNIAVYNSDTNEVICQTRTDSTGRYSCGPFDDDIKLRIEATKGGFLFKPLAGQVGHFDTFKLSSISALVQDEDGHLLKEVLVSISGGENNFRKNLVLNGDFSFDNLHPGQYFVRFMKKEYEFEPSSVMIELRNGEDATQRVVVGKKIAFSCIGTVSTLNGEPESGITVEAIGLRNLGQNSAIDCNQVQEEAVSDEQGEYKILGLNPECLYAVRTKNDTNDRIRESIPKLHSVRVHKSDVTDMNFIAFYRSLQADVSVYVHSKPEFLKTLTVKLFKADAVHTPMHEQRLTASNPFVFLPALIIADHQDGEFIIRVESDLSEQIYHSAESIVQHFRLTDSFMHFAFEFTPYIRPELIASGRVASLDSGGLVADGVVNSNITGAMNPFFSLTLLICGLVFFFHKQIFEFVGNFSHSLAGRSSDGDENSANKKKGKAKKL